MLRSKDYLCRVQVVPVPGPKMHGAGSNLYGDRSIVYRCQVQELPYPVDKTSPLLHWPRSIGSEIYRTENDTLCAVVWVHKLRHFQLMDAAFGPIITVLPFSCTAAYHYITRC